MESVNYWLIFSAVGILEVSQVGADGLLDLDPDDEQSSKAAFQKDVATYVARWSQRQQARLKRSLAYYLDDVKTLAFLLDSCQDLMMRKNPRDIRQFFLWLWEVLYPGEDYRAVDLTGVVEDNDVMQTNEKWNETGPE